MTRQGKCKSCGAPLLFIQTRYGKSMPCEAEPTYYTQRTVEGILDKDRIVKPDGDIIACTIVDSPAGADGYGFKSHWASCPGADKFRRKK